MNHFRAKDVFWNSIAVLQVVLMFVLLPEVGKHSMATLNDCLISDVEGRTGELRTLKVNHAKLGESNACKILPYGILLTKT